MFITRLSLFAAVLLVLASSVFSQSSTAEIKWERYKALGVSVMFPKLPTLVETSNVCSEIERREYYAYADEIVYQLIVASKSATRPPDWCDRRFRFDEKLLDARLAELQNQKIGDGRNTVQRAGHVTFISNSLSVRRIISDMENDRWIELAVYARGRRDPDQNNFSILSILKVRKARRSVAERRRR